MVGLVTTGILYVNISQKFIKLVKWKSFVNCTEFELEYSFGTNDVLCLYIVELYGTFNQFGL